MHSTASRSSPQQCPATRARGSFCRSNRAMASRCTITWPTSYSRLVRPLSALFRPSFRAPSSSYLWDTTTTTTTTTTITTTTTTTIDLLGPTSTASRLANGWCKRVYRSSLQETRDAEPVEILAKLFVLLVVLAEFSLSAEACRTKPQTLSQCTWCQYIYT